MKPNDLCVRFHVRNVIDVPYQTFLDTGKSEEMVLVILGNTGDGPPKKVVRLILTAIKANETSQLAIDRFFCQVDVLSKWRNIQQAIIKQITQALNVSIDLVLTLQATRRPLGTNE